MVAYRTFLDTVSSVICTLDVIDQCDTMVMTESMVTSSVSYGEAWEILQKMQRSGLVVFDGCGLYEGRVVAITSKGRHMAADIRDITGKQVRP